jgi:hypothetical protein
MEASKDYMENMFGASYVSQFLKKKKKKDAEAAETVTCTRDGGHACGEERGEVRAGGDIKEGKKSSASKGEKNVVLTQKQAEKRAKKFEEFRQKEKEKHTKVAKSKF